MTEWPMTWEEFLSQLRLLEEAKADLPADHQWMFYVHPSIAKHHPTVKYLRRYDRRGARMERNRRRGKRR